MNQQANKIDDTKTIKSETNEEKSKRVKEGNKKKLAAIIIPKSKSKTNLGNQGFTSARINEMKKI